MADLKLIRNDDATININFTQDGSGANITGYTLYFTVKKDIDDTDANALISKTVTTHTDAANGESAVSLDTTDTNQEEGSYFYDIQLKSPEGRITSTKRDVLHFVNDIKQATS